MNREIKFRAICKDDNKWKYGYYLKTTIHNSKNEEIVQAFILDNDGMGFPIKNETVGQFTGIYDKNGKNIYEGDIVKVDIDKAIVKYSSEYSGFILKPIGDYYFDSAMLAHNIDIIDTIIRKYI